MRAIDTNVLVRLLVRDDPRQTAAAETFTAAGAWIPHIALVETIWVLDSVYDRSRSDIEAAVEGLLDHESLVIQDPDIVAEALDSFRTSKKADFADCLILAVSQRTGHRPLGTFDTHLAKLDGAELVATP